MEAVATNIQDGKPLTNGWAHLQSVEWLNDKKERQTLVNDGKITAADLPMAVESLSKMNDKDAFHACLRQMPHSWYFKTGDTTGNYPMLKPEGNDKHKAPINKEGSLCGLVEVTKNKIAYKRTTTNRRITYALPALLVLRAGWIKRSSAPIKSFPLATRH